MLPSWRGGFFILFSKVCGGGGKEEETKKPTKPRAKMASEEAEEGCGQKGDVGSCEKGPLGAVRLAWPSGGEPEASRLPGSSQGT